MKKTLKTLIAVILAMIIATGSMSAFAAGETIVLDLQDWKDEYFYSSQLTEGENSINLSGDELYFYHEFEAEKDGYYIVETNPEHIWWIAVAEKNSSGRYIDEALTDYTNISYEEENEKNLFFLEKGSYIIFTDRNEEFDGKTTLGIEYAGAEITGFDFEGGVKYNLIPQVNIIYFYYEENEDYNLFYFIPGNSTLSFDSGKTYDTDIEFLEYKSESEITEGENTITFEIAGKTFEKTVLVQGVEHNIKSVEVKNFDKYDTVKVYYDGCIKTDDIDFSDLEFIVEFSNGEKKTIAADEMQTTIELPNGNPVSVNLYYEYDMDENGNICFDIWVHDKEYAVLPVEVIEASTNENRKHLSDENTFVIAEETGDILWSYMNFVMSMGTDEVFDEMMVLLENLFTFIPDVMKGIFSNFALFLGF